MSQIPYISSSEVKNILGWSILIPAIEESLIAFSRGPNHPNGAVQPLRSALSVDKHKGKLLLMPAYLPSCERVAVKIASLYLENPLRNIRSVHALVTLINGTTGQPLAILEGNSITELRTAAASAVATSILAPERSQIVAIIGAGAQGSSHARVMHYLLNPKEIRIWSRTTKNAKKLVEELQTEGIHAVLAASPEEAVREADVINTCTTSSVPIIFNNWIKDGAHINVVGACFPEQQEVDTLIMKSHRIFVDSLEGGFSESGDIIKSGVKEVTEIGELLATRNSHNLRTKATLFKNLGLAIEDLAAANLVYDQMKKTGLTFKE